MFPYFQISAQRAHRQHLQNLYISENIHSPTRRPKGAQKPSNLHSSPTCWHGISNTIYVQLTYTPQIVGIIYPIQIYISKNVYFPNPVSTRHTETLQLTFIPQVLACYIQYQHTDSTDIYSPKCWKEHSNPMYKGIMTSQRSSIFSKIWQNFMTFDIS